MQTIVALLRCQLKCVVAARHKLPEVRHRKQISPFPFLKHPTNNACFLRNQAVLFCGGFSGSPYLRAVLNHEVKAWNDHVNDLGFPGVVRLEYNENEEQT